jgi:hypothetical protein
MITVAIDYDGTWTADMPGMIGPDIPLIGSPP